MTIRFTPHREDDLIVMRDEIRDGHVAVTDVDVAQEPNARVRAELVVRDRHALDLLMVRRNAVADEPVGRRQALDEVDLHVDVVLFEERVDRVKARRPRPDDGDAERSLPAPGARSGGTALGARRSSRVTNVGGHVSNSTRADRYYAGAPQYRTAAHHVATRAKIAC